MHRITDKYLLSSLVLAGMMLSGVANGKAYLRPPKCVTRPDPHHTLKSRRFTGIPSMAVAAKGRLWATWYAGRTPGEDRNNYVVIATSGDGGTTWKEKLVVDPDGGGPVRAFDPELWIDPTGKLWAFWAQDIGHSGRIAGVWSMTCAEPEKENADWSSPRRLTDGIMMCKPTVLSSGEWVLPASTWRSTDHSARAVVSTDKGLTWVLRGACNVPRKHRTFDEHMIVERKDKSLWMLVRTKYGIGESTSTDRGKTWSALTPSSIAHPDARFFIRRLQSGKLLLAKHGPMDKRTGRSHLMAFLSDDDGKSWSKGLLLDARNNVSYPDGQQDSDGTIYIVYDRERYKDQEILMARITEEDILAGKLVSKKSALKRMVNDAGQPNTRRDNADGVKLRTGNPAVVNGDNTEPQLAEPGTRLFRDRNYTLKSWPKSLKLEKTAFLQTRMDGEKRLRCVKPGMVYLVTPLPDRNKDSQSERLAKQGFQKVALPEFQLFGAGANDLVTVYQKHCEAGDVIEFGKWAVPVVAKEDNKTERAP